MATISNARDISLQATSPRLTVTAVTINATGAGFLKDTNASILTPSSIDFTTVIVGFTSPTYTWSYATSLAPGTFITISGANSSSYTLTSANFLTHLGSSVSVIYKCKVTQTGWADAETTTTINYTKRANDVPVATLDRTSILLPTTADGVVTYDNSGSKITVSIGGTNIPYAASGANSFSVSAAVTTGTITIGTASTTTTTVANDTRSFDVLSAMGAGTNLAIITYTVEARDVDGVATTIKLTQSITKSIAGGSGYVYKLLVPAIVARRLDNVSFTPTTITASATVNIGTAAATAYAGVFKIYTSTNNGGNYTLQVTSGVVSSYTYTLQDYASVQTTNVKVELYLSDGTTLIDSEVIPVNREGQYSLNLTNDNHTVSTPASGQATGLSISSEAEIYFGLTKQTTGWTFNWVASAGITIINAATSTVTVTEVTNDGTVTVTATQTSTNATRTAVFTISRALAGGDAFNIDLLSESDVTSALADGTGYILPPNNTIKLYKAGVLLTSDVTYGPQTTTKNGLTASVNTSTGAVSFSGASWNSNQETFTFTATYNPTNTTYTATYTYAKSKQGSDSILIDLISEASVVSADVNGAVTTFPTGNAIKLYKGGVELTSGVTYGGTATKNGLTLTVSAAGAITLSQTSWSSNEESFNVTAAYSGTTYTTTYSIAKTRTGATGATGATGGTGSTGQSNYRIYKAAANSASTPGTPAATPDGTTPSGWSSTPVTLGGTEAQFQSDGYTPVGSPNTIWGTPYLSYFKVAQLSAIVADLGTVTAGTLKTSTTNPRVEITSSTNDIRVYNSGGTVIAQLSSGAGAGGILSEQHNYTSTTANYWYSPTKAIGFDIESTSRFIIGNSSNSTTTISSTTIPGANATYNLGSSGLAWNNIYSVNAVTVTSDARLKTNIATSILGLNFINQLRPVSYKFIVGGMVESGEYTETTRGDDIVKIPIYNNVEGIRTHYGLIAQEVKATLDSLNLGDFGGFVLADKNDPNSQHSLRYEEFIAPLIKAVQELSAKVAALESRLP